MELRLEAKRKREELQDRRKALLSSLTEQLKAVLARIHDPLTSDRHREQLQTILAAIKDKINALTPQPKEAPRRPVRVYQTTLDNRPKPCLLQLSKLPEEMRGPERESQLRDALGDSVEWIRDWSEDGTACLVRFKDRRQAELAVQDQKAWGFSAKVQDEMPHFRRRPMRPFKEYPARHMHKVFRPPRQMAPGSPDTVAFDSDIEDPEVLASMRLPEPEEVAEAAPEAEAEAEVADAEPLEPVEAAVAAPEAAEPLEAAEAVEAEAEAAPEAEVPETAPEAAPEAVAEAAAEAVAETLQAETEAA